MRDKGETNREQLQISPEQALPTGIQVGHFEIRDTLCQGADFITYRAFHTIEKRTVQLREFFPVPHVERAADGCRVVPVKNADTAIIDRRRNEFLWVARMLSEIEHTGIMPVQQAFSSLGTVYCVHPDNDTTTLSQAAPAPELITEKWLSPLLLQLLNALETLHTAGLLHKSLTPTGILLQQDGTPVLTAPGVNHTPPPEFAADALPALCYTPLEQLQPKLPIGPWSDLYALGAICYHLITGKLPPSSIYRSYDRVPYNPLAERPELHERFSREFLSTIDRALETMPEDRWQNTGEWVVALSAGRSTQRRSYLGQWWQWLILALLASTGCWLLSCAKPSFDHITAGILKSAKSGDISALKNYLSEGGNVNATDPTGSTALNWAVYHNHKDCVHQLLAEPGVDVNAADAHGYGPLFWAIYRNHTDCLQQLLATPALNVNATDSDGLTALHWASRCGFVESTRQLLAVQKVDVNKRSAAGLTPLHEAAANGQTDCMRLLLNAPGVNVNATDRSGATPLSTAVRHNHPECVRMLLAAPGIAPSLADKFGRTPLQVARDEGNNEIMSLLPPEN